VDRGKDSSCRKGSGIERARRKEPSFLCWNEPISFLQAIEVRAGLAIFRLRASKKCRRDACHHSIRSTSCRLFPADKLEWITRHSTLRSNIESSVAVGVRPGVWMDPAKFLIVIR